jgi:hypothetical protein
MLKTICVFIGLVMVLGAGIAMAWPRAGAAASGFSNDEWTLRAYAQVRTGMPFSQLGALGLDTAKAERLSKLALMERFMPKDSAAFDALDPAVRNCYLGSDDCTAYIFDVYTEQMVLLVQGGRVTWKMMSHTRVARNDGASARDPRVALSIS